MSHPRTGRGRWAALGLPRNTVLVGDARERLIGLPAASVDCVVTSPPYFQLRDYGGEPDQLGLEETVQEYVAGLVEVCAEIARVLKPTGSLWLNLRDSYSRAQSVGAAPKSLLLAPERLLLALTREEWIVRNRIVWWKRNCIPESVRDRLSITHEDVFFLTRGQRYFFDLDAIRVAHTSQPSNRSKVSLPATALGPHGHAHEGMARLKLAGRVGHPNGKNPGAVWHLATACYRGAHFASFPEQLVERPILASCPERLCARCDAPWQASYERRPEGIIRTAYRPACLCRSRFVRGVVLDPFFGVGTAGVVARRLGRDWLGIELNPDYSRLARQRLENCT
jgi:site-specific DNA-methyltransferase (adenine-specific)